MKPNDLICFIAKSDYLIKVYKYSDSDWQVITFKDNNKISELWFSQWSNDISGSLYRAIGDVYLSIFKEKININNIEFI